MMDDERIAQVLRLIKEAPGFYAAWHVMRFTAERTDAAGISRIVEIELLDAGPDAGEQRYILTAGDDIGRRMPGKNSSDLEELFLRVNWFDLDDQSRPYGEEG